MAKYKQRCYMCKKNMVLITSYRQIPICDHCKMKQIDKPIESAKYKKFFDIPRELYLNIAFLRSIKLNYLEYGKLTKAQESMFKKVVKEAMEKEKKKKK